MHDDHKHRQEREVHPLVSPYAKSSLFLPTIISVKLNALRRMKLTCDQDPETEGFSSH